MEKLNLSKDNLKKFGITMAVFLLALYFVILFRSKHSFLILPFISAAFLLMSLAQISFLKPIYIIWMKFAFILSWVNTRLILFVMFYLIFTPIGLVIRLFGKDPLDRKIEKQKESYWHKKEMKDFIPTGYEKQF